MLFRPVSFRPKVPRRPAMVAAATVALTAFAMVTAHFAAAGPAKADQAAVYLVQFGAPPLAAYGGG